MQPTIYGTRVSLWWLLQVMMVQTAALLKIRFRCTTLSSPLARLTGPGIWVSSAAVVRSLRMDQVALNLISSRRAWIFIHHCLRAHTGEIAVHPWLVRI